MAHYYDDWADNNREKKKQCKWKNSNRYCCSTRYGCIDCDDYEPEYEYLKARVKELTEKLKIAKEALFFISGCVKVIEGYDEPIPTAEACKAYSALKEIGEL